MVKRSGFTFIEIILVLAIVMVVGVTSAALSNTFLVQESLETAFEMLRADMRKAQLYAMSGKNASIWGVALRDGDLVVFRGTGYDYRDDTFDERIALPRGVTLSGFDEAVFERESGRLSVPIAEISLEGAGSSIVFSVNHEGALERSE